MTTVNGMKRENTKKEATASGINDADECLLMRNAILAELRKNEEIERYLTDETDDEFRKILTTAICTRLGSGIQTRVV